MIIKDFENIIEVKKKVASNSDTNQFEHFSLKIMEGTIDITNEVTLEWSKDQQKEWQLKFKKLDKVYIVYQLKRRSRSYVYNEDGAIVKYNEAQKKWIPTGEVPPDFKELLPKKVLSLTTLKGNDSKFKIIRKGIDITEKTEISIIIT